MSIPSLAQLLVDGGDSRITLDTHGVNKYGCTVEPQSTQDSSFAFGSATASTISQRFCGGKSRLSEDSASVSMI
jgi:hypothetical protein